MNTLTKAIILGTLLVLQAHAQVRPMIPKEPRKDTERAGREFLDKAVSEKWKDSKLSVFEGSLTGKSKDDEIEVQGTDGKKSVLKLLEESQMLTKEGKEVPLYGHPELTVKGRNMPSKFQVVETESGKMLLRMYQYKREMPPPIVIPPPPPPVNNTGDGITPKTGNPPAISVPKERLLTDPAKTR